MFITVPIQHVMILLEIHVHNFLVKQTRCFHKKSIRVKIVDTIDLIASFFTYTD